jgi:aryl-alcohol dehydrogenase-like predicted oxidoreductase
MVKQVDKRLAALGTDYIDLLFFHGLDSRLGQTDWPKRREMKAAVEAIKKTGKVRFVGSNSRPAIFALKTRWF